MDVDGFYLYLGIIDPCLGPCVARLVVFIAWYILPLGPFLFSLVGSPRASILLESASEVVFLLRYKF